MNRRTLPPVARITGLTALVALTALAALAPVAHAELSRGVVAALKGELVITKGELPEGKSDKETIAKIKAERVKEVAGEEREDVVHWHFHYTAFLTKPGSTVLKMEFYTNDKDRRFVADKRLDGVDPKITAVSGEIAISEDDGLAKGKPYLVKLVNDKDAVVASTPLVMK